VPGPCAPRPTPATPRACDSFAGSRAPRRALAVRPARGSNAYFPAENHRFPAENRFSNLRALSIWISLESGGFRLKFHFRAAPESNLKPEM